MSQVCFSTQLKFSTNPYLQWWFTDMETEKNKRYIYVGDIVIVVRTSELKPKDPDFNSCSEHPLDFA